MDILIITNQVHHGLLIKEYLIVHSISADVIIKPMEAFQKIKERQNDMILVDYNICDIDCFKFCELLGKITDSPIIMFGGSKDAVQDECKAFDVGCSDYIYEPYSLEVLLRRIKKCFLLVDPNRVSETIIKLDKDLVLNVTSRKLTCNDKKIHLTYKEFEILTLLCLNPNRIYSRDEIIENVWPVGVDVDSRSVDTHIKNIRRKSKTELIEVIRNVGYRIIL